MQAPLLLYSKRGLSPFLTVPAVASPVYTGYEAGILTTDSMLAGALWEDILCLARRFAILIAIVKLHPL